MRTYFIVYNPATYDFMSINPVRRQSPLDLITYLANRDVTELSETHYLEFLYFDLSKRRQTMVDSFGLENGAAIYVGNQLARLAPEAKIIQADDNRRTLGDVIKREGAKPSAVFITSISSNFPAAVAATIILNHAGIPVVLGGIHVSTAINDTDDYIRKYCPNPELVTAARGPADSQVIGEILRDLEQGALKRGYVGHTTIEDGVWRTTPNVEILPPICMGVRGRVPLVGRYLANKIRVNPVAPLLGCPYNCSFCSISTLPIEQRRLCARAPDDFLAELASYQERPDQVDYSVFLFTTDNLLLGGEVLDEILDGMIARKLKAPFMAQISIEVASNEKLLERLRLAGALLFEIGFESLRMENLEHINKHCRFEIEESGLSVPEYYSRQIKKIQDHGISIQGSFIFGLPYDRFDSVTSNTGTEVAQFCIDNHISLMAGCLSAQPGARAFQECLDAGTLLYGPPGTMEYLSALCIADHSEMNIVPPDGLKRSPLLVGLMALEALREVGSTRNGLRNAMHMAGKSFAHPTVRGQASFRERMDDSLLTFASELITASLYRDIGERLLASSHNGLCGGLERLYQTERDPEVRGLFEALVSQT